MCLFSSVLSFRLWEEKYQQSFLFANFGEKIPFLLHRSLSFPFRISCNVTGSLCSRSAVQLSIGVFHSNEVGSVTVVRTENNFSIRPKLARGKKSN